MGRDDDEIRQCSEGIPTHLRYGNSEHMYNRHLTVERITSDGHSHQY